MRAGLGFLSEYRYSYVRNQKITFLPEAYFFFRPICTEYNQHFIKCYCTNCPYIEGQIGTKDDIRRKPVFLGA